MPGLSVVYKATLQQLSAAMRYKRPESSTFGLTVRLVGENYNSEALLLDGATILQVIDSKVPEIAVIFEYVPDGVPLELIVETVSPQETGVFSTDRTTTATFSVIPDWYQTNPAILTTRTPLSLPDWDGDVVALARQSVVIDSGRAADYEGPYRLLPAPVIGGQPRLFQSCMPRLDGREPVSFVTIAVSLDEILKGMWRSGLSLPEITIAVALADLDGNLVPVSANWLPYITRTTQLHSSQFVSLASIDVAAVAEEYEVAVQSGASEDVLVEILSDHDAPPIVSVPIYYDAPQTPVALHAVFHILHRGDPLTAERVREFSRQLPAKPFEVIKKRRGTAGCSAVTAFAQTVGVCFGYLSLHLTPDGAVPRVPGRYTLQLASGDPGGVGAPGTDVAGTVLPDYMVPKDVAPDTAVGDGRGIGRRWPHDLPVYIRLSQPTSGPTAELLAGDVTPEMMRNVGHLVGTNSGLEAIVAAADPLMAVLYNAVRAEQAIIDNQTPLLRHVREQAAHHILVSDDPVANPEKVVAERVKQAKAVVASIVTFVHKLCRRIISLPTPDRDVTARLGGLVKDVITLSPDTFLTNSVESIAAFIVADRLAADDAWPWSLLSDRLMDDGHDAKGRIAMGSDLLGPLVAVGIGPAIVDAVKETVILTLDFAIQELGPTVRHDSACRLGQVVRSIPLLPETLLQSGSLSDRLVEVFAAVCHLTTDFPFLCCTPELIQCICRCRMPDNPEPLLLATRAFAGLVLRNTKQPLPSSRYGTVILPVTMLLDRMATMAPSTETLATLTDWLAFLATTTETGRISVLRARQLAVVTVERLVSTLIGSITPPGLETVSHGWLATVHHGALPALIGRVLPILLSLTIVPHPPAVENFGNAAEFNEALRRASQLMQTARGALAMAESVVSRKMLQPALMCAIFVRSMELRAQLTDPALLRSAAIATGALTRIVLKVLLTYPEVLTFPGVVAKVAMTRENPIHVLPVEGFSDFLIRRRVADFEAKVAKVRRVFDRLRSHERLAMFDRPSAVEAVAVLAEARDPLAHTIVDRIIMDCIALGDSVDMLLGLIELKVAAGQTIVDHHRLRHMIGLPVHDVPALLLAVYSDGGLLDGSLVEGHLLPLEEMVRGNDLFSQHDPIAVAGVSAVQSALLMKTVADLRFLLQRGDTKDGYDCLRCHVTGIPETLSKYVPGVEAIDAILDAVAKQESRCDDAKSPLPGRIFDITDTFVRLHFVGSVWEPTALAGKSFVTRLRTKSLDDLMAKLPAVIPPDRRLPDFVPRHSVRVTPLIPNPENPCSFVYFRHAKELSAPIDTLATEQWSRPPDLDTSIKVSFAAGKEQLGAPPRPLIQCTAIAQDIPCEDGLTPLTETWVWALPTLGCLHYMDRADAVLRAIGRWVDYAVRRGLMDLRDAMPQTPKARKALIIPATVEAALRMVTPAPDLPPLNLIFGPLKRHSVLSRAGDTTDLIVAVLSVVRRVVASFLHPSTEQMAGIRTAQLLMKRINGRQEKIQAALQLAAKRKWIKDCRTAKAEGNPAPPKPSVDDLDVPPPCPLTKELGEKQREINALLDPMEDRIQLLGDICNEIRMLRGDSVGAQASQLLVRSVRKTVKDVCKAV
ncbi:hypothetical protein J8273_8263 [Carpediemonas membranifera]|uniref:Uncharacterized protein n=1 Tax=Carpediemonas membranifera TaxID=201153 RepID=A0A8J6APY1_9EUKA|nr:hypothetical protein J8273_8263 [Carpediemonas membranifera]|eukprot:KAG9390223.1 hypothetical protein J8273_8263 [Carpediemonas membranifera]